MNIIFNREKLTANRNKSVDSIKKCPYFQQAAEDIMMRLNYIDKDFVNVLDLGCRSGCLTKLLAQRYKHAIIIVADSSNKLLQSFGHAQKLLVDEENLKIASGSFDLITFSLGLQWINDVQKFLLQIRFLLKENGIFIGNFVGGNSLSRLKKIFIDAEIALMRPTSPHISPFIHFDHVTPLLSSAGFAEIIVDYENIELKYRSPLEFIRELKNIGESGALNNKNHYAISKQMLAMLRKGNIPFVEQINVISFIASPNKNSIKLTYK